MVEFVSNLCLKSYVLVTWQFFMLNIQYPILWFCGLTPIPRVSSHSPLWWRCLGPGCKGAQHDWPPGGQGWEKAGLHSCCCFHCGFSLTLPRPRPGDGTGGSQPDSCPFPRSGSPRRSPCHQTTAGSSAEPTGSWWREPTSAHAALHHQLLGLLPLEEMTHEK